MASRKQIRRAALLGGVLVGWALNAEQARMRLPVWTDEQRAEAERRGEEVRAEYAADVAEQLRWRAAVEAHLETIAAGAR